CFKLRRARRNENERAFLREPGQWPVAIGEGQSDRFRGSGQTSRGESGNSNSGRREKFSPPEQATIQLTLLRGHRVLILLIKIPLLRKSKQRSVRGTCRSAAFMPLQPANSTGLVKNRKPHRNSTLKRHKCGARVP